MANLKHHLARIVSLAGFLLVTGVPAWAWACPTCKDGLSDNYVAAYSFSIVFMMVVPYLLLAGFFAYIVISYFRRPIAERKQMSADDLTELALKKAEQGIPTQPPAWDS
ncbi:hypothetical protein [Blastopirellula marina]|uniref:Uncharacterized protein n=1 Tax=Blastopirellula marina TaxID=124 RepID=A0A2S8F738_9BACT|nr:hypothetical protein [Blastopirellula marina]PQO27754.1 hypothetical protein C5Y98_27055 [Blastopirellula marina]PTL41494.1 hypothetical protein C5Y97_27070 [Blastopirellula marina]